LKGLDFRCPVRLRLETDRGPVVESATYTVSTDPAVGVIREMGDH
jgi:hypothetical protein